MNAESSAASIWRRSYSDYGMVVVLLLLCVFFSVLTYAEQHPTGRAAGKELAADLLKRFGSTARVLIVAGETPDDAAFVDALKTELIAGGATVVAAVKGTLRDARQTLQRLASANEKLDAVACPHSTATSLVFANLSTDYPELGNVAVIKPRSYNWPNFLKADNLLNITNQIAVIAVVAIGMTLVIITGGIDLSVGSLIALSAVVATWLIRNVGGALDATPAAMILCSLAGIAVAGVIGICSGVLVTFFKMPPFIVTLGFMSIASGLASKISRGQSIYEIPPSFVWLGGGKDLIIPNSVLVMLLLYAAAHIVMSRTIVGRYLYAVGGNREAARLSGVPVPQMLLLAYFVSGLMAGFGGVILASQLKSGSPQFGQSYELDVITAVVVGGTSLSGGEGKVFSTLIGAFIIAVIKNGLNLMNVDPYTQKIVLGSVLLLAVLFDILRRRGWGGPRGDVTVAETFSREDGEVGDPAPIASCRTIRRQESASPP